MSAVFRETCALAIFPSVEPPAISERFAKVCTGTFSASQMDLKTAAETASVVYFWLALNFKTIPPLT